MILDEQGNQIPPDQVSLRKLTFGELPGRMKLKLLGLLIVIAVIGMLSTNLPALKAAFNPPAADVSLEDVAVSDDGFANRVDLFLLNTGGARATVTRGWIDVVDELRIPDLQADPETTSPGVAYDAAVKLGDDTKTKTALSADFGRQIGPMDTARISLNLTTSDAGSPTLLAYKIQVGLAYNGTTELSTTTLIIPTSAARTLLQNADSEPAPELEKELAAIHEWLNDSTAVKGPAVRNMIAAIGRQIDQ